MYIKTKKVISFILFMIFMLSCTPTYASEGLIQRFSDVPIGHWADKSIHDLRALKITVGIGNNEFGLGLKISRKEFVVYLVNLMQWELIKPDNGSFIDNMDTTKWYFSSIETALKNGTIQKSNERFRPNDPITREEMAIMIVNTLGYDLMAKDLTSLGSAFDDVTENMGYITIAKDFGIIAGVGGNKFKPYDTATREQAAAMMMRMYERLNQPIEEMHAFYAIRSANQADMIKALDSVSFGWSRLEYNKESQEIVLNTTRENNNEYAVPQGFDEPINIAQQSKVSTQLMVFADNSSIISTDGVVGVPLLEHILNNPEVREQAINSIVEKVNAITKDDITVTFDGVVIDFESMKGEQLKNNFNIFLKELKLELDKIDKKLYVAVHPKRKQGLAYYDGYDYKAIGEIADKVILMAHDYYAKKLTDEDMVNGYTTTPLTPINEIYYALQAITDKAEGVQDLNKISIQISFDSVQWKLKDGKVINSYPYHPGYESIRQRLIKDVVINYSNKNQNPYVMFYDKEDQTDNVLWYEDSRSAQAKINLARMFGIKEISLWRLGNIPDYEETDTKKIYLDIWQQILSNR